MKADDPKQYDSPEMNWQTLGAEDARKYFRDALDNFIEPGILEGKNVLDIGSGVGHTFGWLKAKGVALVTGIDPAKSNVRTSKENYPWARSEVATLGDFAKKDEQFDVALAILVFEHIEDLNEAFRDVNKLLNGGGKFYLIISDKDYSLSSDKKIRSESFVSVEIIRDLGNGTVETKTIRNLIDGKQSVMYDFFRPIELVRQPAEQIGFKLFAEKTLFAIEPDSVPMMYVMGFKKS